jgi:hypothetical protein
MTFTDAITAAFKDNDRITRRIWNNRDIYCEVVDGRLCINFDSTSHRTGEMHPWTITEQDFFADDWEVLVDG